MCISQVSLRNNQENCCILRELIRSAYRRLPEPSIDDSLHSKWREVKLRSRAGQSMRLDVLAASFGTRGLGDSSRAVSFQSVLED